MLPPMAQGTAGAGGMWGKGALVHCWWKSNVLQPLWATAWRALHTLQTELPWGPATTLLGIYPKHMKTITQKHTRTPVLLATLFTRHNTEATQASVDKVINEMTGVYTHARMHTHTDRHRNITQPEKE